MRAYLVCVVAPGAEEHRSLLSHGLFASVYVLLPQVAGSESYGWHDHDLRRGHAKDLQKSRHPLCHGSMEAGRRHHSCVFLLHCPKARALWCKAVWSRTSTSVSLSKMLRWRQPSCLTMRDEPCDDGQVHLAMGHQFACCTVVCLNVIGLCAPPVHRAQRGSIGVSPYTVLKERRPSHTHCNVRSTREGSGFATFTSQRNRTKFLCCLYKHLFRCTRHFFQCSCCLHTRCELKVY